LLIAFGKFMSVGHAHIATSHVRDLLPHAVYPVVPNCDVIVFV